MAVISLIGKLSAVTGNSDPDTLNIRFHRRKFKLFLKSLKIWTNGQNFYFFVTIRFDDLWFDQMNGLILWNGSIYDFHQISIWRLYKSFFWLILWLHAHSFAYAKVKNANVNPKIHDVVGDIGFILDDFKANFTQPFTHI